MWISRGLVSPSLTSPCPFLSFLLNSHTHFVLVTLPHCLPLLWERPSPSTRRGSQLLGAHREKQPQETAPAVWLSCSQSPWHPQNWSLMQNPPGGRPGQAAAGPFPTPFTPSSSSPADAPGFGSSQVPSQGGGCCRASCSCGKPHTTACRCTGPVGRGKNELFLGSKLFSLPSLPKLWLLQASTVTVMFRRGMGKAL